MYIRCTCRSYGHVDGITPATCPKLLCAGLGNPRGNENPFLLTFGVLWFRYHNYWARRIEAEHKDENGGKGWSDERIFNEARKMVVGVHQVTSLDFAVIVTSCHCLI